ncbi:MAG TPA: hypothetical protein VMG58_07800 [Candidatus Sulfotelmatobacter sp.]|nr:hypothetical protein [Candidatus Sulfotelmatobacter sp.]
MRPFTVLGYSVNDEILCHACLKSTTGLRPADLDYSGRPILPLYAVDATLQEESCTYCGHPLLDLVIRAEAGRSKASPIFRVEKTRHQGRYPALKFDRRPPANVLKDLKDAGWRWEPGARCWSWYKGPPVIVPPSLGLPPPLPKVTARPPIVRKRPAQTATA